MKQIKVLGIDDEDLKMVIDKFDKKELKIILRFNNEIAKFLKK